MSTVAVVSGDPDVDAEAVVAAEKRARHRVLVKRAYHQKLNTLQTLRQQEQQLKARYDLLLSAASAQTNARVARGEVVSGGAGARELYVQLAAIREQLQHENRALQRRAREHEQFQSRLTAALSDDNFPHNQQQQPRGARPYMKIRPLSEQQCFEVIRPTHARVKDFMRSHATLTLGSEVFGWTHRYRFPPDGGGTQLQYSIAKTFPGVSAATLCARGWAIMTTPQSYRALHSTSMASQLHVLQRVNRDNAVLCRMLRRKHAASTRFKTLLLASQFQVERGYMTIYRALDHRVHIIEQNITDSSSDGDGGGDEHGDGAPVVWLDMFAWTSFEDLDDGVRFEFGGSMQHTSRDNAQFWMLEVLLMALRWEAMAVGPLFTLTAAAATASP